MKIKIYLLSLLALFLSVGITEAARDRDGSLPSTAFATERGLTSVQLDSNLIPTLQSLSVTLTPLSPSTFFFSRGGIVSFPVDSGVFDPAQPAAEISHSGGLVFTAGNTRLVVSSFVIEISAPSTGQPPILTALATLNGQLVGRIPLFDLDLSGAGISGWFFRLRVTDVGVTLNADAAATLNSIFGTTALAGGFPIGQARVNSFIMRLPAAP